MPKNSAQDIEAAITFTERNKRTHELWITFLELGGIRPDAQVGDLEHHTDCVNGYEHVLAVLREVAQCPVS